MVDGQYKNEKSIIESNGEAAEGIRKNNRIAIPIAQQRRSQQRTMTDQIGAQKVQEKMIFYFFFSTVALRGLLVQK